MFMKVVEKIGRAGNSYVRERNQCGWDLKYGKNNWEVVYQYNGNIMMREDALRDIYYESYYLYLKNNPSILKVLCETANEIYNPHAENTGGVDLQCPAVLYALKKLNVELNGQSKIAIGTWGIKKGYTYPQISYQLSPFKVPIWCDETISVEQFWQEYKFIAINE